MEITDKCGVNFLSQVATIKLQSNDGKVFVVPLDTMKQSTTIKAMVESLMCGEEDNDDIVKLPVINSTILNLVIEWCIHHKYDLEQVEVTSDTSIDIWDKTFLNVNPRTLMEIINAANYLEIKYLMGIASLTMANNLRGKHSQQMRQILGVRCDFTNEELQEIEKENVWLSEK